MKKKMIKLIPVTLCVVLAVCSCAYKDNGKNNENLKDKTEYQANLNAIIPKAYSDVSVIKFVKPGAYISVIGKSKSTSYWSEVKRGAKQAEEDLNEKFNYEGDDRVKVVYTAPSDIEDIDEQVNILDEELAQYPDAIVIASISADACQVQFDLAMENKIPIIAMDSYNNYHGILCNIMTDNAEAAKTCAYKLYDEMQGTGRVLMVVHDSDSGSALERAESFYAEIDSELADISIADMVYLDKMEEIKGKIAEEKKDKEEEIDEEDVIAWFLEQKPDITGLYGTNEKATQLAVEGAKSAGKDKSVSIVGFDAGEEQLEDLKEGRLKGIVVQNPFGIGYASAVAAFRAVSGMDNEPKVDTGYIWVTQDNIENDTIKPMLYE